MYRIAIEKLYEWKKNKHRKPLIIEGARQVGTTWLMKEFASKAYANTVYINIDALKHYYFIGGMPEAVQSFAENKDFNEVREIQKCI